MSYLTKVIPETLRGHKIRSILIVFGIFPISLLLFGLIVVHDQQNIFIFYYNIALYFPLFSGSFCLVVYVHKSLYFHASIFVLLYSVV
jgi:hypothetical protein